MNNKTLDQKSHTYTLSAIIVGYLLTYDYSSYTQNAIGNWFMTVGQILEANAAFMQAINEPSSSDIPLYMQNKKEIDEIKKVVNDLIEKINNLNI